MFVQNDLLDAQAHSRAALTTLKRTRGPMKMLSEMAHSATEYAASPYAAKSGGRYAHLKAASLHQDAADQIGRLDTKERYRTAAEHHAKAAVVHLKLADSGREYGHGGEYSGTHEDYDKEDTYAKSYPFSDVGDLEHEDDMPKWLHEYDTSGYGHEHLPGGPIRNSLTFNYGTIQTIDDPSAMLLPPINTLSAPVANEQQVSYPDAMLMPPSSMTFNYGTLEPEQIVANDNGLLIPPTLCDWNSK